MRISKHILSAWVISGSDNTNLEMSTEAAVRNLQTLNSKYCYSKEDRSLFDEFSKAIPEIDAYGPCSYNAPIIYFDRLPIDNILACIDLIDSIQAGNECDNQITSAQELAQLLI